MHPTHVELLTECAALAMMGYVEARSVTAIASEALIEGIDTQSLRELAGLYDSTTQAELADALTSALRSLGVELAYPPDEAVVLLALRAQCRAYLRGRVDDADFTQWVHDTVTHDGPDQAQDLVSIDDEFVAEHHSSAQRRALIRERIDEFLAL